MNDPWFKNNSHLKIGIGAIIFNGMSGRYGLKAMSLFCGLIMIFFFYFIYMIWQVNLDLELKVQIPFTLGHEFSIWSWLSTTSFLPS